MSWLFSRALVEGYSAATCSDGAPSALLSVMPTAHRFWRRGKMIESSDLSLFGLTCVVLTEDRGKELLMLYLAGFPARTLAQQEKAQESTASAAESGQKWCGSLAKYDPATHTLKTAQLSFIEDSTGCCVTLPRWGLMRDGVCLERERPGSRISATASGSSLPTPSGVNGGKNNTMGRIDEWGGSSNPLRGTVIGSMCLPEFEEMVMGWPIRWTALTPFATARFQEWQQQHGECLQE